MKNILLINDFLEGGGAEAVFRDQIEILSKDENFKVDSFYAFEKISDNKLAPFSYIYSRSFKKKLAAFLENKLFDFIIIHNFSGALSPSILDALSRYKQTNPCKIIYYAHDYHLVCANRGFQYYPKKGKLINFKEPPSLWNTVFKRLDHRGRLYSALKKVQWINAYTIGKKQNVFDLMLAPSDFLTGHLKKRYPDKDVNLMYNSCNALCTHKKSLHLPGKTLKLVYFGRLGPEKGLKEFIKALAIVKMDFSFAIIGEGEDKPNIQKTIKQYHLEEKICIKPKMNHRDLFIELQNYDVFVLPSVWYENAPLSIVEAASLGLGLFLAGHGGILEIGKICNATHFFNPENIQETALRLDEFYIDFQSGAWKKADNNLLQDLFSKEIYMQNLRNYLKV